MKTSFASVLIASLLAVALPGQANANLIQDGSFEAVSVASGHWTTLYSSSAWSVATNGYEIRNNVAGVAEDGKNFVELDTSRNSAIWQTISTTAGKSYDLSFWYAPRAGVAQSSNPIEVLWNGNSVALISGDGSKSSSWTEYSRQVVGTGGLDTLTFRAVGTSDSYGGSLDNVGMTAAVPEPETYALLLAGLGLMGTIARRRRKE